jgi:DNA replication protein DnaD
MEKGYVKLWRKFRDHPFWREERKFSRAEGFLDLVMSANGTDKTVIFDGSPLLIRRGQLLTSERKLAERWRWSKTKTRLLLFYLQNSDRSIEVNSDHKKTLITITNYNIYNPLTNTEKTTSPDDKKTTEKPLKDHRLAPTNKDRKKEKDIRPEFFTLVDLLSEKMRENDPKTKIPETEAQREKWATDFRLLVERDGRPIEEVKEVLAWCQKDSFWRANILSAPKFRERFAQLKLKMEEQNKKLGTKKMTPEEFNKLQEEALKRR